MKRTKTWPSLIPKASRNPLAALPMPLRLRQDSAVAARLAGARGRSAVGIDYVDRLTNYQEQNGPPYKTTPRQRRRLEHKAHHQEAAARRAIDRRAQLGRLARMTEGGAVDGQ